MVPKDPLSPAARDRPGKCGQLRPRPVAASPGGAKTHTFHQAAVPTGLVQLALRGARRPCRLPQQACEGLWVSLSTATPGDTLNHSQEERASGGGDEVSLGVRK